VTGPDSSGPFGAPSDENGPLVPPPLVPPAGSAQPSVPQGPAPQDSMPSFPSAGGSATQAGIPSSPNSSYAPYGPHSPHGPYGATPPQAAPGWNQQAPYAAGPAQPYGAAYPYGPYNPYGYGPQPTGTSGLAIASLVTGICGFFCVTPLVSIGLGIAALVNISRTGRPGKGMAIAGLILSGLWIALFVFLIATGHVDTTSSPTNQTPNGTSA